nr:PREDICTED: lithostathine-2-like [Linepithema humile]
MMFKYLLVVLVVWCETQRYAFAQDTSTRLLSIPNVDNGNLTAITEELSKKPVIAMNGNNNYNVGQQIFYIYDEDQLKRILINNKHSEKLGGTGTSGLTAHKLVTRKLTWNYARQACNTEGGYLAIINSEAEEELLLRLMKENNVREGWLGIHDLYQEGEWITVEGDPLEETGFTKWTTKFPNQPDNYQGNQNCGMLLIEGGLDDENCNHVHSYICEMAA